MILVSFLIFLAFLVFLIFPAGRIIIYWLKINVSPVVNFMLSVVIGLILLTLEGLLVGLLGKGGMMNSIILIQGLLSLIVCFRFIKLKFNFNKEDIVLTVTSLVSLLMNLPIMAIAGSSTALGVVFPGVNSADNLWHLALINSLEYSLPPANPIFSGINVSNYHYLVDLQVALMKNLLGIPTQDLLFKLVGPFYIFLYAGLSFALGRALSRSNFGGVLAVLFTSLASNWYYLAKLFFPNSMSWPSVAWVDYFSSKSVNYPLLFSMVVLLTVCYMLFLVKRPNAIFSVVIGLILGSLISFKSHTALVLLASFLTVGILSFKKYKFILLGIIPIGGVLAILLIFTLTNGSGQSLLFYPFWFIKVMFEAKDRLNYSQWELQRQYYLSVHGYLGIIKLYIQGILIFSVVNLGILPLGILCYFMKMDEKKKLTLFLLGAITFWSVIFTMAFIYNGVAIITIQFFYPAIVALSILFSIFATTIYKKFKLTGIIFGLFFWLSITPGVYFTLSSYLDRHNFNLVSKELADTAGFLSKQPKGVVITNPQLSSNSFISAFSAQQSFLADEPILTAISVSYQSRELAQNDFFKCKDKTFQDEFAKSNKLKYILTKKGDPCFTNDKDLTLIYTNALTDLYSLSFIH